MYLIDLATILKSVAFAKWLKTNGMIIFKSSLMQLIVWMRFLRFQGLGQFD